MNNIINGFFSGIRSCLSERPKLYTCISGLSCYYLGIPGMLCVLGTTLAADYMSKLKTKVVLHNASGFSSFTVKNIVPRGINGDIPLKYSNAQPPKIRWDANSCFLSTPIWTFFLNEPTVLNEIPKAISRRLTPENLLEAAPEEKGGARISKETQIIERILFSSSSLTLQDFRGLFTAIKALEDSQSFPPHFNKKNFSVVLSLLEIYFFLKYFENAPEIPGEHVNLLRNTIKRIQPEYQGTGAGYGDAHEVIIHFGSMIFEGSEHQQNLHKITYCSPAQGQYTLTGGRSQMDERSDCWGNLEIPVGTETQNLQNLIDHYFQQKRIDPSESVYYAENNGMPIGRKAFDAFEKTSLKELPPFLVLQMKRGIRLNQRIVEALPGYREVTSPILELKSFTNDSGESGAYQLKSVITRLDHNHYDAHIGKDFSSYHCDDCRGVKLLRVDQGDPLVRAAKTGDILFFRRVS